MMGHDMNPLIYEKLAHLSSRYRSQAFAALLGLFWGGLVVLAVLGYLPSFWYPRTATGIFEATAPQTYLWGLVFVGPLALFVLTRFGYRDFHGLANRLEKAFPDLEERLLTLLSPSRSGESEFMRNRLTLSALQHADEKGWESLVPGNRLRWLWVVQTVLAVALFSMLFLKTPQLGSEQTVVSEEGRGKGFLIEPGDIELEAGSDLLVTVRYGGGAVGFAPATLQVEDSTGELVSTPMQGALNDAVASATVRRVKGPLQYRVQVGGEVSETYRVSIYEHPALVGSDAAIQYPAYSGLEPKEVKNTRRVTAVDGSTVAWTFTLNKPVDIAELVSADGGVYPLERDELDLTTYRFPMVLSESTKYQVRLVDGDGRGTKVIEELSIKVLPNQEPQLKLTSPLDQRVTAIEEIVVSAKVQDDFGLIRTGLQVTVGDDEPKEIILEDRGRSQDAIQKKLELQHLIDLESLDAKADQLVTYYFWTEDQDREGQLRRVESDLFFAEVRPFEELFREGDASASEQRQQQQQQQNSAAGQQAEDLAELQKKILAAGWNILRQWPRDALELPKVFEQIAVVRTSQEQALEQSGALQQQVQDERSQLHLQEVQTAMRGATELLVTEREGYSSVELRESMAQMRKAYEGLLRLRAREHEIVQSQQQQSQNSRSQSSSQKNRQQQIEQLQLEQDASRYEEESQPMAQEEASEREARQVMNRLDELAKRQADLNEQIREIDLELQAEQVEEKRKELEEQLERLREDQQEMIRDTDEVLDRMQTPQTRDAMEQARQQVEQAREQMQQAQEQLGEQKTSSALNSATRAQQSVDQTREELREGTSRALERQVSELVQQAKELETRQSELERLLREQVQEEVPLGDPQAGTNSDLGGAQEGMEPRQSMLRSDAELARESREGGETVEAWKSQQEEFRELLEGIKETVEQAESGEPLLAEQLYETYRESMREGTQERMERISQLLERGLDQPALEDSRSVSQQLQTLRQRVEEASESVLGSEAESLRRALQEIQRADEQVRSEMRAQAGEDSEQADSFSGDREGASEGGSQRNRESQSDRESQRDRGLREDRGSAREVGAPGEVESASGSMMERLRVEQEGGRGSGVGNAAPMMGEDYAQWSDRLRDIEELVRDPEWKAEAARIREAAREFRMEYKRHAKEPQWDLVKELISDPLKDLQKKVREELLRKTAKQNELVPLDRDPVPERFQRKLDRYFEELGTGERK
jgi:hypothetical protein